MTSKEKQVCIECGDYKNCPYVSRNLEHKCQHLSDIMYGFELGHKDAIDKACEWLEKNYFEIYLCVRIGYSSDEVVEQYKKYIEEQQ